MEEQEKRYAKVTERKIKAHGKKFTMNKKKSNKNLDIKK